VVQKILPHRSLLRQNAVAVTQGGAQAVYSAALVRCVKRYAGRCGGGVIGPAGLPGPGAQCGSSPW